MTTIEATNLIRDAAKNGTAMIFATVNRAPDDALIATAEGMLDGISEALVKRIGAERAFMTVARAADILDRVLLDNQWPSKPGGRSS